MSQSGSLNTSGIMPSELLFLEGDVGGLVGPTANTIFIVGGPNVEVVGNPGTSTLTINTDGTEATVQTVNAIPTSIALVTVAAGFAATITLSFVALQDTFASGLGGTAFTVARNAGGGAILAGGGHQNIITDTPGNPEITFGVVGNDVQIFVTGAAATILDWRMFIRTSLSS